jgi:hypothetical protein
MDDCLEYMSHEFIEIVMSLPDNLKAKYKEALALIVDQGMRPEQAFRQSGFHEAYEKERGSHAS